MTVKSRHFALAIVLHAILFFFIFVGVQCSQKVETTPVVQGVLINPNDLKALKPPTPPSPTPTKPDDLDQGPQQIVKDTDVVADQAKQKQEQAAAEQKKLEEQKAEEQKKAAEAAAQAEKQKQEQAKAEELKRQQEAQKQAAEQQAAAQKKQQEEAQRKAADQAAAERKKELDEQLRKEAQEQKDAQAAAIAKQKKAEEAQRESDRRKREAELQKSLGVESAQLKADIQNEWVMQLIAAMHQAWKYPTASDPKLKAYVDITLARNGQVQNVSLRQSSGIVLFDQSVIKGVRDASPLPLPRDMDAFDDHLTNICFSPDQRNCGQ